MTRRREGAPRRPRPHRKPSLERRRSEPGRGRRPEAVAPEGRGLEVTGSGPAQVGAVVFDNEGAVVYADLATLTGRDSSFPQILREIVQARLPTKPRPGHVEERTIESDGCPLRIRVVFTGGRNGVGAVSTLVMAPQGVTSLGSSAGGWRSLTAQEQEIVALAVQGLTNTEIATRLGLSTSAVKYHLTKVYKKTGAKNRGGLAACLLSGGSGRAPGRRTKGRLCPYSLTPCPRPAT